MIYRLQHRNFASNIIEKNVSIDPTKEKWIVWIAPLCNKEQGDKVASELLEIYNKL